MRQTLETITPHIAEQLLADQISNRAIRKAKVREWAKDMQSGIWEPIPQPIMIDAEGRLIDGQHRLAAVVQSGCTVTMMVARDVPTEWRRYIDSGTARAAADVLKMQNGTKNAQQVQATAKYVIRYESSLEESWSAANAPGKQQVIDEYNLDPDIYQDAVLAGSQATATTSANLWMTRSSYGSLYILTHRWSSVIEMWPDWHEGISTGIGLHKGDPRLALRNSIRKVGLSYRTQQLSLITCIKAWNHYVNGRDISRFIVMANKYLPMPEIV